MGFFDFFGREPRTKEDRSSGTPFGVTDQSQSATPYGDTISNGANAQPSQAKPFVVFSPTSYRSVESIIDTLKNGKSAIVHLTGLKTETAIRVTDMLSGAVYALGGGVYEVEKNVFMFSPSGVEIK